MCGVQQQAVRVTLLSGNAGELDRQAIAGYYGRPGDDQGAVQAAVLWMRKGATAAPSLKIEVPLPPSMLYNPGGIG